MWHSCYIFIKRITFRLHYIFVMQWFPSLQTLHWTSFPIVIYFTFWF